MPGARRPGSALRLNVIGEHADGRLPQVFVVMAWRHGRYQALVIDPDPRVAADRPTKDDSLSDGKGLTMDRY